MINNEIIITIQNIIFYKGNIIDNGMKREQIVFTNDENFRVDLDDDLIRACNRIYNNYYK
jgi:hypothetical protein